MQASYVIINTEIKANCCQKSRQFENTPRIKAGLIAVTISFRSNQVFNIYWDSPFAIVVLVLRNSTVISHFHKILIWILGSNPFLALGNSDL